MKFIRPLVRATPARLLVSLALCASPAASVAFAQSDAAQLPAKAEQEEAAARAALETKAFKLLEEAASEADSLRSVENRARLQAAAGDALWPHDREAAREIFQSALAGVASLTSALAADDPRYEQHYHNLQNLRRTIILAVGRREPRLALEFVRGTRLPAPRSWDRNYYQPDPELALEAQLAEVAAERDPREALRLAEEGLSRGVSGHLPNLLERVRQAEPQAASKLAADIVAKLRAADLATNYEAVAVVNYLLNATRPQQPQSQQPQQMPVVVLGGSERHVGVFPAGGERALALDEATRRELIVLAVNAALAAGGNERRGREGAGAQLLPTLQGLLPEIERAMPAQAAALRRRLPDAGNAAGQPSPRTRQRELEDLMATGSSDAILQAASRAPENMRWQLQHRAAMKALEEGSPERARQIVNDSVADPRLREQLLREIDQQVFWRASNEGDTAQAHALLARFKVPEERMQMTLSLAHAAASRGNHELAGRLLEEVLNQTGTRARDMGHFSVRLQAAQAYAQFAPERAFEIAEAGVEQLNELLAAAAQVDGFGQESFEQDELKLEGNVWSALIQQSGEVLSRLAAKDFDRAREVAARFQRPEARSHALLAVARGVLGGEANVAAGRRDRARPIRLGRQKH